LRIDVCVPIEQKLDDLDISQTRRLTLILEDSCVQWSVTMLTSMIHAASKFFDEAPHSFQIARVTCHM